MILDELLFNELNNIGKKIMKDANLNEAPKSSREMDKFWEQFEKGIEQNKSYSILLGNILFHFITNEKIRDRQTNSRIFEDIFSGLFGSKSTDLEERRNPEVCKNIFSYDKFTENLNWSVSLAMSGNKREKCDVFINDYSISIKTLKGPIYDKYNKIICKKTNTELNIGSFNYNALLIGLLDDDKLNLSDRKDGLGSGKQLRENVFDIIVKDNKQNDFYDRLDCLFRYVYEEDDIYIVLKSHYNIQFILIPGSNFVESILLKYIKEEETFQQIWYRWENNNLRFNWMNLLKFMDQENIKYYRRNISLSKAISNSKYNNFIDNMRESISKNIKLLLKEDEEHC